MFIERKNTINCGGKLLNFDRVKVMGIINLTPDSFYDGGKYSDLQKVLIRAAEIVEQGADFIDIGAVSTRPNSYLLSFEEEKQRLLPALELIKTNFANIPISIDTFRSEIAEIAVNQYGANIINDISAGSLDPKMFETVARLKVPYIAMHIQGTPQDMQNCPHYDNVIEEIVSYFAEKTEILKQMGVNDIIIDPGFGFGKTIEHNFELLKRLDVFKIFELPLLVGLSRKSMIYKFLKTNAEEALNGTSVLNTVAIQKGANILRVHDVKEAVEVVRLLEMCK